MPIAWAPPTAYTSSMPSSAHAARIVGCGSPSKSFCGGEATAMDVTPAACAATTFMTTELGYTASPPGTYRPTRATGIHLWLTFAPAARSTLTGGGTVATWNERTRSEEHTSELQSRENLVCRLLLEKKK